MDYKQFSKLTYHNNNGYLIRGGILRDKNTNCTLIIADTYDNEGYIGIPYNNVEKISTTDRYDNLADLIASEFFNDCELDTDRETDQLDKELESIEFIPSNEVDIDINIRLHK